MQKILWLDVETSGFSPRRNGILSIAAVMMLEGLERGWFKAEMDPVGREIEEGALAVNGFTLKRIGANRDWKEVAPEFVSWMNSFDLGTEAALCGGYVNSFDAGFVESWLEESQQPKFGSFVDTRGPFLVDVCRMAKASTHPDLARCPNHKLVTVSAALDVHLSEAHTAEADIDATIEIWRRLTAWAERKVSNE